MKSKGFIESVRIAAKANRDLWVPGTRTTRTWPLCLTCGREVDSVDLCNANNTSVEIRATCRHLAKDCSDAEYEKAKVFEDFYKVTFPYRLEGDFMRDDRANWAVKRAMQDGIFFDPNQVPK